MTNFLNIFDIIIIIQFNNEKTLDNYKFSKNSCIFSSYSLSELQNNVKNIYYDKLLSNIDYGFFVWNTHEINIPKKYKVINNDIKDVGNFVYLE